MVLAGCSRPVKGRVLLLGLDGLDPDEVARLSAEGKLPNLARLAQRGVSGRALSLKPYLSPLLWTTVATGRKALDHGITHFTTVDPATGVEVPMTSTSRRVPALWNIASDAGRKVGVVGWWATWPPEPVNGFVVSDRAAYHFLSKPAGETSTPLAEAVSPPALAPRIERMLKRPSDLGKAELQTFGEVSDEELARPFDFKEDLSHLRWALAAGESTKTIGLTLWNEEKPDLLMLYIEAPDSISHLFGHLHRRAGLAGELAGQSRRWGGAVEAVYVWADRIVGEAVAAVEAAGPGATLVIVSDHGFALGVLPDDPALTRDPRRATASSHRPEGVLMVAGGRVRPGSSFSSATLLDLAPTLLSLLGLPPSKEMPGRVLAEVFTDLREPDRVAAYRRATPAAGAASASGPAPADQAAVEHLRNLGYLGGAGSVKSDRNLAALHFEEGHFREAASIYFQLVTREPDDVASRTGLAASLSGMKRFDDALREARIVLEKDPLNLNAIQVEGNVLERLGRKDEAIAAYRRALRYKPDYGPARRALVRITGSEAVRTPAVPDPANVAKVAAGLAEATASVQRGDYPGALKILDAIEPLAPSAVEIHQTRSNAAYLMGDRALAAKALKRALAIEPDNALFARNLKRLEKPD